MQEFGLFIPQILGVVSRSEIDSESGKSPDSWMKVILEFVRNGKYSVLTREIEEEGDEKGAEDQLEWQFSGTRLFERPPLNSPRQDLDFFPPVGPLHPFYWWGCPLTLYWSCPPFLSFPVWFPEKLVDCLWVWLISFFFGTPLRVYVHIPFNHVQIRHIL